MIQLDLIDRRILDALRNDNRVPNLKLSELVGISPPACLRRVRRVRKQKVMAGDVSPVDPGAAGRSITVILEVVLDRETNDVVDEFKRTMAARIEVTQRYMVTGKPDFALVVQVRDSRRMSCSSNRSSVPMETSGNSRASSSSIASNSTCGSP